jgi:hypothetical protein
MIQIQVKSQEDQHQFPFITIADPYLTLTERRYVWECIIMTAIHHHWRFWSTLLIYYNYIWITNNKLDTSSCFLLLFLYCSSLDAGSIHPLLPYNTQHACKLKEQPDDEQTGHFYWRLRTKERAWPKHEWVHLWRRPVMIMKCVVCHNHNNL